MQFEVEVEGFGDGGIGYVIMALVVLAFGYIDGGRGRGTHVGPMPPLVTTKS